MKKKIELNKKTIKRLKLKLGQKNDRKVAPAVLLDDGDAEFTPTGGFFCTWNHQCTDSP
jgi:hypothetical protein